jgi:Caspase domain
MQRCFCWNRASHMLAPFILVSIFLIDFSNSAVGSEVNSKFLFEKEPRRLALIVGNAKYEREHVPQLPGSKVDLDEIEKHLKSLHFETVIRVDDVKTREDFEEFHLKPFLDSIHGGELVLFYYSGHGFSYGGDSYLVPTKFPLNSSLAAASRFIPIDAVRRTITAREPGILVTILDSCRNNLDLSTYLHADNGSFVAKSFPVLQSASNEIINYASAPNSSAQGSTEAKASVYTAALVQFLNTPGLEWGEIVRDVYTEVSLRTQNKQIPWRSDSNAEYVYLVSTDHLKKDFREAWVSTLRKGTADEVKRFVAKYALTPYGAAARQWLEENNRVEVRNFTRVSPVLVDKAWVEDSDQDVKVAKLTGPIGFGRSTGLGTKGLTLSSDNSLADILLGVGEIVVLANLNGRAEPQSDATVVKTYRFGSRLPILDYVYERGGKVAWFKVRDADLSRDLYVRALAHVGQSTLDLGQPLQQFFVGSRPQSLPTLVDDKTIQRQIKKLRDDNFSISWVSIAVPKVNDPLKSLLHSAWATNATYILTQFGIPKGRITSVSDASLTSDNLRVRIFGNPPKTKRKQ